MSIAPESEQPADSPQFGVIWLIEYLLMLGVVATGLATGGALLALRGR